MSDTLTVINRTANNVVAGASFQHGTGANTVYFGNVPPIPPGGSTKFSFVSGTGGPYQVGFITMISGSLSSGYHNAVIAYDVFANSIVTLAMEVGTRVEADAADPE